MKFTDSKGRDWAIEINVSAIRRVRSLIDIDLLDVLGGKLIDRLISDPVLLCDVLFAVCAVQAKDREVTSDDFGSALAGDAISAATDALIGEIIAFSPSPRDRQTLGLAWEKMKSAIDKQREKSAQMVESADLDRAIETALERSRPGGQSGSAPESSG